MGCGERIVVRQGDRGRGLADVVPDLAYRTELMVAPVHLGQQGAVAVYQMPKALDQAHRERLWRQAGVEQIGRQPGAACGSAPTRGSEGPFGRAFGQSEGGLGADDAALRIYQ